MARPSFRARYAEKLRERSGKGSRWIDLRLDVVGPDGEALISVGGRWDRKLKDYVGDGEERITLEAHEGQVEPLRYFSMWAAGWLGIAERLTVDVLENDRRTTRKRKVRSVLTHGGRRGGKTHAMVIVCLAFAILQPGSRVWIVSPSQPETDEVELALKELLPRSWYSWRGAPKFSFKLPNGSIIWLRSAHNPEVLKRGRCDFAGLNEAQKMARKAYLHVRGALSDRGGIAWLAANPPQLPIGMWVADMYDEINAKRRPARAFFFDPRKNPHIEVESLEDMELETDRYEYDVDVLGIFRPRKDVVFYNWIPSMHIRALPDLGSDVTELVLERAFPGRKATSLFGSDFQCMPMVAVELRFFRNPAAPRDLDRVLTWFRREWWIPDGDEDDLATAILADGVDPSTAIIVGDASGAWQGAKRIKGVVSFDILKRHGFTVVRPDRDTERNPNVAERCKIPNGMLRAERLFSVDDNENLNKAMRLFPNKRGVPSRTSEYAHIVDAGTYPLWRVFPRRSPKPKAEIKLLGGGRPRRDAREG